MTPFYKSGTNFIVSLLIQTATTNATSQHNTDAINADDDDKITPPWHNQ